MATGKICYRDYRLTKKDRLVWGAAGAALGAAVSWTFYRSVFVFLVLCPLAFFLLPLAMRKKLGKKRQKKLAAEFSGALSVLSGFLSAGVSTENAFQMSTGQLEKLYGKNAMIAEEFRYLCAGLTVNRPVGEMLGDFAGRSGIREIGNFAEVFAIAGRTGGSLGKIIAQTASVLREKMAVTEEIRNKTASRRYEQKLMNVIPFGLILYLNLAMPGFMDVMYETLAGRLVMTACLALSAGAWILSDRMLEIDI